MAQQCPLIFRQIDANIVRINTFFVISVVVAYLFTNAISLLLLLIIDFLLRLYGYKPVSPIQNLSLMIQKKFSIPTKMEDAGAKRLAAFFGVGFTIALVIFDIAGIKLAVEGIAAVYLFCASLELLFGYCIACKIYYIAKKVYPQGFK